MLNLKVGVMPGKLNEVVVNEGTKVKEVFAIAELNVEGMEYKLDGRTVDENEEVHNGGLLVAMKRIKGNARTVKVGVMPGKLTEVVVDNNETVKGVFAIAGLNVEGMEYKLDGREVHENDYVDGNLLVAMKRIKGNAKVYVTKLSEEERKALLGVDLPREIEEDKVQFSGTMVLIGNTIADEEIFSSVYDLEETVDIKEVENVPNYAQMPPIAMDILPQIPTPSCRCEEKIKEIEKIKEDIEQAKETEYRYLRELDARLEIVNKVLDILK